LQSSNLFNLNGHGINDTCGFIYNQYDRLSIVSKKFLAVTETGKRYPSFFDGYIGLMPTPGAYGTGGSLFSYMESSKAQGNIDHMIFSIYIDTQSSKNGSVMFGNYDLNGASNNG
jgi:hypothetical protein